MTAVLTLSGLSCGYHGKAVIENVNLQVDRGGITMLLGPNGVGKTTLFKTILGVIPSLGGKVMLQDDDVAGMDRRRFAQQVAYVPQHHDAAFDYSVFEMVLMGRTPALSALATPSKHDEEIAHASIKRLGIEHLEQRSFALLSGGQQQMALIARALTQQPALLLMDEPCASLDIGNQHRVLTCIAQLASEGLSVVVTTHDPNHALLLGCDVACLMPTGEVVTGQAAQILSEDLLGRLYGAPVGLGTVSGGGVLASVCGLVGDGVPPTPIKREEGNGHE